MTSGHRPRDLHVGNVALCHLSYRHIKQRSGLDERIGLTGSEIMTYMGRGQLPTPLRVQCGKRVSNPRPTGWKPVALPAELLPHMQQSNPRWSVYLTGGLPDPAAMSSGEGGTRTHDILLAKQALFQLSYIPMIPRQCGCIRLSLLTGRLGVILPASVVINST